ncbi:MAG: ATP-binding cassette domain-containing protein [Chitinophagaceae bacterium]|nr:ATP-binding cassette domain-containing protein [Oligoflexus sp.]
MSTLLDLNSVSLQFGGIIALNRVSLSVEEGSITAIIGPNGAGKTTLFNCITGFYRAQDGQILLSTKHKPLDLVQLLGGKFRLFDAPWSNIKKVFYGFFGGTHLVARAGIARTFQNIRLFSEMTVVENLLVAQHRHLNRNVLAGFLNLPGYRKAEAKALECAFFWLDIIGLSDLANQPAAALSYGNQRRLEIARAMCTEPRLICLDEPAAGLNPNETDQLSLLVKRLRDEFKVTVLVIEHDMSLVMSISDHIVVLNYGEVIAKGSPKEVQANPKVLAAYLGSDED